MGDYSQGQNNNLTAQYSDDEMVSYEQLLDLIAEALIVSEFVNTTDVENNQKFIRNGQLQPGQGSGVLALFQKDIKANQEDLNNTILDGELIGQNLIQIASNLNFDSLDEDEPIVVQEGTGDNIISISINGGGEPYNGLLITDLVVADGQFSNTSQFIPLSQQQSIVDVERAEEFLDTNIFELLPTGDTRQSRIIRFFQELNVLLPPEPEFDLDNDNRVDRAQDGTWDGSLQYNQDNSISYAQENQDGNIDEEDAFIHRLKSGSVPANDTNQNRTIEDIYNTILPYLTDILEDPIELEDMPEYDNKSAGYLKFRNLNQGIIIRNTNKEFVEGLNPNNPTWLDNGFTITMWVRFLDKVSTGTLFNYGNPMRGKLPENDNANNTDGFGFKLETFILNKDDKTGWPETTHETFGIFSDYLTEQYPNSYPNGYVSRDSGKAIYENTDSARFVRLVVNGKDTDGNLGHLRSSEAGNIHFSKYTWNMPELPGNFNPGVTQYDELLALGATHIPENFNEWYFICATYNPNVYEPDRADTFPIGVYDQTQDLQGEGLEYYAYDYDFWMNHRDVNTGLLVDNSGYGNQCKVEIISKTDLLRARGFKG